MEELGMDAEIIDFLTKLKSKKLINFLHSIQSNRNTANCNKTTQSNLAIQHCEDLKNYIIKKSNINQSISAISSAKMYNDVGLKTPPISFIEINSEDKSIITSQQDVTTLKQVETILADNEIRLAKLKTQAFGKYKWQMFYDIDLISYFLQFMTTNCIEQLKNIFLADEIRTDVDRHLKNYFLYKHKNSAKYEGAIVIDLEQMAIYTYCRGMKKSDFDNFLFSPYHSATPQTSEDYINYSKRADDIRELIQDGVLSQKNINILKNELNTDFPNIIKENCQNINLTPTEQQKIVIPIQRLWEYNQQTIGKDLGL